MSQTISVTDFEENIRLTHGHPLNSIHEESMLKLKLIHETRDAAYDATEKALLELIADLVVFSNDLKSYKETITELESDCSNLNNVLSECETQLEAEKESKLEVEEQLNNANKTLDERDAEIVELKAQLTATKEKLADVDNQLKTSSDNTETLIAENKQLKEKIQALTDELAEKTKHFDETKKALDKDVVDLNQQTRDLQTKLASADSYTSYLKAELKDERSSLAAANKENTELKSNNEAVTKSLEKMTDDYNKTSEELAKLKAAHELLNAKLEKCQGQLKDEQLRSESYDGKIAALTAQVDALTSKNHDVETQLASSKTLAEQLNVQLSVADKANEKLESEKGALNDDLRKSREVIGSLRNEIQELMTVNGKI